MTAITAASCAHHQSMSASGGNVYVMFIFCAQNRAYAARAQASAARRDIMAWRGMAGEK